MQHSAAPSIWRGRESARRTLPTATAPGRGWRLRCPQAGVETGSIKGRHKPAVGSERLVVSKQRLSSRRMSVWSSPNDDDLVSIRDSNRLAPVGVGRTERPFLARFRVMEIIVVAFAVGILRCQLGVAAAVGA